MRKTLTTAAESVEALSDSVPELERLLRYIPLIGDPIAHLLMGFRTRPIVRFVEQELLRRRVPEWTVWGDDLQKALFAQSLCELAMLEMGWPNDRFIPSDPAAIIFWNHRDTLDFSAVIRDLEDNLGMKITAEDTDRWYGRTIGDLVDDLWERHIRAQGWPPPPVEVTD